MKTYDFAPRALALLAALAVGCAAPVAPEDPNASNSGGSSGSSGRGASGGAGGTRPDDTTDELPGVTVELGEAPQGCLNAAAEGAVNLQLDSEVPSVSLEATDGTLHANGVACTDTAGAEVPIASLTAIGVTSTGADAHAAILELGSGDWSALLELPEAIRVEFSGGAANGLIVRGTEEADLIRHGMRGSELVLDLVGDGRINLVATGVTVVGISLAGGDDELDDLSEIAAERANLESDDAEDPEEPVVPVTTLSLPLVAEGGDGDDWLLGGLDSDVFKGGAGDDVLSGLAGNDVMDSAEMDGADLFNGGLGYDYVSYEQRTADLTITLCVSDGQVGCVTGSCSCAEVMSGEADEEDRLINVDDVAGGSGDDTMHGTSASDTLSGGPGDDHIFGEGGSDVLYGQSGDDVLDGGPDGDYCGNTGQDQAIGCEL